LKGANVSNVSTDIEGELDALQEVTTGKLDGQPFRKRHRAYLIRRNAWRIQANAEGELSERAHIRRRELWTSVGMGHPIYSPPSGLCSSTYQASDVVEPVRPAPNDCGQSCPQIALKTHRKTVKNRAKTVHQRDVLTRGRFST
jgi:hypothetical protein